MKTNSGINLSFKIIILLLTVSLSTTSLSAKDLPTSGEMVIDLVLARPLGIVATVIGTSFFIIATPFTLLSGTWKQSGKKLVLYPAKYTFTRGLGDFPEEVEEIGEEYED